MTQHASTDTDVTQPWDGWALAARYYWQLANNARKSKDFTSMRELTKQAEEAEHLASPDARLMMGIFGGKMPNAPVLVVQRGAEISQSAALDAKTSVKDEIKRFSSARKEEAAQPSAPKPTAAPQGEQEWEIVRAVQAKNSLLTKAELKEQLGISGIKLNAMIGRDVLRIGRGDRVFAFPG